MNFSKYSFLLMTTLLVIFAKQSNAGILNTIGNVFESAADVFTSGVSAFVDGLRDAIAEAKQHQAATKAKADLDKEASDLVDNAAAKILLKQLKAAINDVADGADSVYEGLKQANKTADATSQTLAVQTVIEAFETGGKFEMSAAIKSILGVGAATQLSKDGAAKGLNEATQLIAKTADVGLLGLKAASDLAIQGIKAGKDAPIQAILAAFKGVQSIEEMAYNLILKIGKISLDAIRNESSPVVEDLELDAKIEKAAAGSPKCQNAIKSIEELSEKALSGTLGSTRREAIEIVRDGLIRMCKNIALAEQPGYMAMTEAKKMSDKEAALITVDNGVEMSKNQCLVAIAYGQQALGAAASIAGPRLIPIIIDAIIRIETARMDLITALSNASILAVQGIEFDSQEMGLTAGQEAVATAGFSGYARAVESAKIAFDALSKN